MKVKCIPEDFIVNEIIDFSSYPFLNYKITDNFLIIENKIKEKNNKEKEQKVYIILNIIKNSKEHFELIKFLKNYFSINDKNIFYCGIKDKHSISSQFFSLSFNINNYNNNDNFNLKGNLAFFKINNNIKDLLIKKKIIIDDLKIKFLGLSFENINSDNIQKNNFSITLRDIEKTKEEKIIKNINNIKILGFPNFFDEQRFGSFKKINGIPGKYYFLRNYEKFIVTYLEPYEQDKKEIKEIKNFILANWRNWDQIKNKINNISHLKKDRNFLEIYKIINFISNFNGSPSFYKSTKFINKNLILLFLNSYQSLLFNSLLNEFLKFISYYFNNIELYKFDRLNKISKLKYLEKINANYFYFYLPIENEKKQNNFFLIFYNYFNDIKLPLIGYDFLNLWDNFYLKYFEEKRFYLKNLNLLDENFFLNIKNILLKTKEKALQIIEKEGLDLEKMKIKSKLNIDVKTKFRNAFVIPENLNYFIEKDDIYKNKLKVSLNFNLPKGSYATILIKRISI
jgi:tRNA pseudouridine13 synthase